MDALLSGYKLISHQSRGAAATTADLMQGLILLTGSQYCSQALCNDAKSGCFSIHYSIISPNTSWQSPCC